MDYGLETRLIYYEWGFLDSYISNTTAKPISTGGQQQSRGLNAEQDILLAFTVFKLHLAHTLNECKYTETQQLFISLDEAEDPGAIYTWLYLAEVHVLQPEGSLVAR